MHVDGSMCDGNIKIVFNLFSEIGKKKCEYGEGVWYKRTDLLNNYLEDLNRRDKYSI